LREQRGLQNAGHHADSSSRHRWPCPWFRTTSTPPLYAGTGVPRRDVSLWLLRTRNHTKLRPVKVLSARNPHCLTEEWLFRHICFHAARSSASPSRVPTICGCSGPRARRVSSNVSRYSFSDSANRPCSFRWCIDRLSWQDKSGGTSELPVIRLQFA